jgi:hypothetical protein
MLQKIKYEGTWLVIATSICTGIMIGAAASSRSFEIEASVPAIGSVIFRNYPDRQVIWDVLPTADPVAVVTKS